MKFLQYFTNFFLKTMPNFKEALKTAFGLFYILSVQYPNKASYTWQSIENIYGGMITNQNAIRGKRKHIEGFQKCSVLVMNILMKMNISFLKHLNNYK